VKRRAFITLLGGAAAVWPLAARAQQSAKSYRIAFLALIPGEDTTLAKPLLERLHELGYSDGTNMSFVYRSAEGEIRSGWHHWRASWFKTIRTC
jgi:hypothetical protein